MKKTAILSMLLSGTAYGVDSWLTCIGKTAGRMALYPVKVIINKGPRFIEEEASGLYNSIDTPNKVAITVTTSAAALVAGILVLGPASLMLAPVGIVALDYSYPDDE